MRVAILDLGTNTFNLLIADVSTGNYQIVVSTREVVKLGEEGISKNLIAPAAFQRGINALANLAEKIRENKVQRTKILATSAIREAANRNEFIAEVKKQTGIAIEIISGEEEAELIYFGNRMAVSMGQEPCLIMDIGGGSNEFIIANDTTAFWKHSFKLGVARLLAMFKPEDPISQKTLQDIKDYLQAELQPLLTEIQNHTVTRLIGSSGAFESVLQMIGKDNLAANKTCYDIDLADYFHISKKTIHSTREERNSMPGLIPMRRDMIVLSYILIDFILEHTPAKKISISTYSLKEGAISLFMKQ
jgi:exopolyphosphatase/guanosine-5'-triphosphate,3'-diphosphate pyrophosphatase